MGSWPEGVPLPPTPQKPEGITEAEWQVYLNNDPLIISPAIRDKVERAMGWKDDDVDAAREIAERVLGAVKIAEEPPVSSDELRRQVFRIFSGLARGKEPPLGPPSEAKRIAYRMFEAAASVYEEETKRKEEE